MLDEVLPPVLLPVAKPPGVVVREEAPADHRRRHLPFHHQPEEALLPPRVTEGDHLISGGSREALPPQPGHVPLASRDGFEQREREVLQFSPLLPARDHTAAERPSA